ncbi:hypothetical protein LEMLEM_LOCUS24210 [Lemmus lemmus]
MGKPGLLPAPRPRDSSQAWTSGCRMPTGPPFLQLRAQPHHLPTTCTDPGLSPKPGSFGGVTFSCAILDSTPTPSHTIKFLPPKRGPASSVQLAHLGSARSVDPGFLSCFTSGSLRLSSDTVCCDCPGDDSSNGTREHDVYL